MSAYSAAHFGALQIYTSFYLSPLLKERRIILMATRYSGEALRAISACSQKACLQVDLWGMLCKLEILRTKSTRRGCRAGLRKQQLPRPPILLASSTPNGPPSCTLRSERDFISLSQDGGHLNISTWTTLNI